MIGVRFLVGAGNFLFSSASGPALGPNECHIKRYRGTLSAGIKQPEHEADRFFPSSAEDKNAWSYASTPPYVFIAWYSVKQRDKFIFQFAYLKNKNN
jgi:hypothetical protein